MLQLDCRLRPWCLPVTLLEQQAEQEPIYSLGGKVSSTRIFGHAEELVPHLRRPLCSLRPHHLCWMANGWTFFMHDSPYTL